MVTARPMTFSATGRRKEAVARVTMIPGKGNFVVNGRDIHAYLCRETLVNHATEPLLVTDLTGGLDIACSVKGGGISGQAGAIRLAVARAIVKMKEDATKLLRKEEMLTRDSRMVERKKYGRPKARKRFQYSKR